MRAHTAFRRIVLTLVALALLAGQPRDAWAAKEQDWWGWLEEFSGPGPFKGWELSLEVLCINLAQREEVPVSAYATRFAAVEAASKAMTASLTAFTSVLQSRLLVPQAAGVPAATQVLSPDELKQLAEALQSLQNSQPGADLQGALARIQKLGERAFKEETTRLIDAANNLFALSAATAAIVRSGTNGLTGASNVTKSREFSKPRGEKWRILRSCREVQAVVDGQREQEETRLASYVSTGVAPKDDIGNPRDRNRLVIDRRDWQTGIVINFGSYQSLENGLFDPDKVADDEPQVRLRPFEVLAHSKLSSSIDIGAGLGFARITTEGVPGTVDKYPTFDPENADSKVFYLVPLSVVVRPGRLFTNSRWASILGYRMSLRYFGDLDTANFAVRPPPTPQTPGYKQSGEFVWGAAFFVDLVSAFEFAFNPKDR